MASSSNTQKVKINDKIVWQFPFNHLPTSVEL